MIKMTIIVFMFLVLGCVNCTESELLRVTSPDGKLDAVLIGENCGGALGSYVNNLYIVQKGKREKFKKDERALEALSMAGEQLRWIDIKTVEIKYKKARILSFRDQITIGQNKELFSIEIREAPFNILQPGSDQGK